MIPKPETFLKLQYLEFFFYSDYFEIYKKENNFKKLS